MYTANSGANMEPESDDSERWEDFYGSSSDLTPALLRIYDTLNTTLETKYKNQAQKTTTTTNSNNFSTSHQRDLRHTKEMQHTNEQTKYDLSPLGSTWSLKRTSPARQNGGSGQNEVVCSPKHRNNIRLLSPSVQRLIIHSDVEHVDTIDIGALQQSGTGDDTNHNGITPSSPRFTKKLHSHTISGHGQRSKLSHIPLSKVTGQLTAAGNELVPTFNQTNGEYINVLQTPQMPPEAELSDATDEDGGDGDGEYDDNAVGGNVDNEKTPTNGAKSFVYDFRPLQHQQSIQLMEIQKLATTTQLLSSLSLGRTHSQTDIVDDDDDVDVEDDVDEDDVPDGGTYSINAKPNFGEKDDEFNGIMEAINTSLVNMQQVMQFKKANQQSCDTISEASTSSTTTTTRIRLQQQQAEKSEIGSTESLDRPTEMKFGGVQKLMLPEIAKLKHRPLSSSSLCSTSSSSSSGSDNLNSKLNLNMPYLASVESLAEHNEPGMTILERSCLEIFESERNYVEDLRQVITGYLSDWKERACLRVTELQTLFSNIEDIYEFSSKLLSLLSEAAMDPVKIAKCFMSMQHNFDVYTKYCTSYPEAISLLTKLLQATHTNALLASTQKRLQHTLPLGSYLLKPVQRILKYHLLLDNLRKHCDAKEVTQAYEIMRQVARHIDQVKRRLEQQSRVKELSGILDGWLGPELTVLGELRLEGLLMEHNKPRMVFLFATMLIITKPKEDNRLIFKSLINQNNLMLNEHLPGEPTSFYVIPYDNPRNQIKLTAKNRDQKRVWTQHIKEAMLERFGNIPNRAKELVFKLGDEEERSPDKSTTRKWTINSTSVTPTYLERRNQYRRTELRKRSKQKRKTVTDLSSIEAEVEKETATEKPIKPMRRNSSVDDSMVPRLLRLAAVVRNRNTQQPAIMASSVSQEFLDAETANEENQPCACKTNATRLRSKSVPKINFPQEVEEQTNEVVQKFATVKPIKTAETKELKEQAMLKRSTPLKKQRNTTKRDTFKFYMDISEFDQSDEAAATTVLKITESTENITKINESENEEKVVENRNAVEESLQINEMETKTITKTKNEAQIVQELLKDSKEFERLYKKSQRKRSTEACPTSKLVERERAPTPPSTSPPLLTTEADLVDLNKNTDAEADEPIYESLLRNVHVPYKFSPDFKRSKSLQCAVRREKKVIPPPRPESDYVMLKYTAEGSLEQIGCERISTNSVTSQKTLCPDTVSLESDQTTTSLTSSTPKLETGEAHNLDTSLTTPKVSTTNTANHSTTVSQKPRNLVRRLFESQSSSNNGRMSSLENISNALLSRKGRRKSIDSLGTSNKPPERRASDVTEMCRLSILHRQGSQAVGERMASVDYADPRTLFGTTLPINQLLRDSVVSLTSSSDSVHGSSNRFAKHSSTELSTNFEYEDDVEASLEQNFRDSAIYSDDNERRPEMNVLKHSDLDLKCILAQRKSATPPELPPKPPKLKTLMAAAATPGVVICPPNMNKTASRSWVLQQIENFSK